MWQAEADTELTMSASPATAVGQLTLTIAKWSYCTVIVKQVKNWNISVSK